MRTYKEFISILEDLSGGSLMFTKRFGSSGLGGSSAATVSAQGGSSKGTQFSGSGTVGRGTVSGQGDKINRGLDATITNYNAGGGDKEWKGIPYRTPNADTSTSTIRKGAFGSFNANISGGSSKPTPTPTPKPTPKPVAKPAPMTAAQKEIADAQRWRAQRTLTPAQAEIRQGMQARGQAIANQAAAKAAQQNEYQAARARLEKGGYADAAGNAYTGSQMYASKIAGEGQPGSASAGQALKDLKLVGDANRAAREARSTGVIRGTTQPDGSVVFKR